MIVRSFSESIRAVEDFLVSVRVLIYWEVNAAEW
jgi:hypothetical protein